MKNETKIKQTIEAIKIAEREVKEWTRFLRDAKFRLVELLGKK